MSWLDDHFYHVVIVVAVSLAVGMIGHAIWFDATYQCAEFARQWVEESRHCTPNFMGTQYYGDICTYDPGHWGTYCARWEKK